MKKLTFKDSITLARAFPKAPNNYQHWQESDYLDKATGRFESDRARLLNSPAIRRLQQKTQVFPLERNASVRSRLTHSLEVQQNGRFIVKSIFKLLSDDDKKRYELEDLEGIIESIVEMACLSHDIGNPPFGHFGEYAIQQWFKDNVAKLDVFSDYTECADASLKQQMILDLQQFEGNAQAIRLVTQLLRLNLTYTQTACLLKYTRPAYAPREANSSFLKKKPGYYLSEEKIVKSLWHNLKMDHRGRHPLTWIMEAADDISYGLADLEDAVEKGILDIDQVTTKLLAYFNEDESTKDALFSKKLLSKDEELVDFASLVQEGQNWANRSNGNKVNDFFTGLRVSLIHVMVNHAAKQFIYHLDAILAGTHDTPLMEDGSPEAHIVEVLKRIVREHVFPNKEVEELELRGYTIIYGLFDIYSALLRLSHSDFIQALGNEKSAPAYEKRLANRLANRHVTAYQDALKRHADDDCFAQWERYYRCRLLQDFISGMTDQFAFDEYRALTVSA